MNCGPDELIAALRRPGAWSQWRHAAADEIERLRAENGRLMAIPCPYVRQADEGTAYCSLAERRAT